MVAFMVGVVYVKVSLFCGEKIFELIKSFILLWITDACVNWCGGYAAPILKDEESFFEILSFIVYEL